jgi:preprotein translocase subunit SecE
LRPTGKRTRRLAEVEPEDTDEEPDTDSAGSKDDGGSGSTPKKKKAAPKPEDRPSRNPIAFVINYLQEVVAELRKVIWPNRKQMVSYTTVVLFFLIFMVAMIGGVDIGLSRLVTWVFG